jgi:hypothetical protein
VAAGDDSRLSDSRTPVAHTHPTGDVTGLGTAAVADTGTGSSNVILGNDARLSDARTPSSTLAHKSSHVTGGSDAISTSDIGAAPAIHTHTTSDLTGGIKSPYVAKTATYPIVTSDYIVDCTSGTFTVTLPTAASDSGRTFIIKNSGVGTITVATTSSQTIDGALTQQLGSGDSATVVSNGSGWIVV